MRFPTLRTEAQIAAERRYEERRKDQVQVKLRLTAAQANKLDALRGRLSRTEYFKKIAKLE